MTRKFPMLTAFGLALALLTSLFPGLEKAAQAADDLRLPWTAGATWNVTQGMHSTRAWDFQPPGAGSHNDVVLAVGSGTAKLTCQDGAGQAIVSLVTSVGTFRYIHLQTSAVTAAGITTGGVAVTRGQMIGRLHPSPPGSNTGCGWAIPAGASHLHLEFPSLPLSLQGITFTTTSPNGGSYTSTNTPEGGGDAINYVPGSWTRWNSGDHKAISAPPSPGSVWEGTLGNLLTSQVTGTVPVYSCNVGADEFTSLTSNCEGQKVNGLLGFIYKAKPAGVPTRPIYRCTTVTTGEHFDSPASNCEGQRYESLLGYAVAYTAWNRWNNGDHKAILGPGPSGATWEGTLGHLLTSQITGTVPVYSCNVGADEFTSLTSNCEGQKVNGLLGFIYKAKPAGVPTRGIYRCTSVTSGEHFDSPASSCEGQRYENLLGYAVAYT